MLNRQDRSMRVPATFVALGTLMSLGVLSMAYGYYQSNNLAVYLGVGVTLLSAFNVIFVLITHFTKLKVLKHSR